MRSNGLDEKDVHDRGSGADRSDWLSADDMAC